MAKRWVWTINFLVLGALVGAMFVIERLTAQEQRFMLNCASELTDRNELFDKDVQHYLLVDLVTSGSTAQVNYRYYSVDGSSAGSISMQGKVDKIDQDSNTYFVSVSTKQETPSVDMPQHMQYLSYVSSLNINEKGEHNLSLELLDIDKAKDYAVVLFQPSNTVCGCRLVH